MLLPEYASSVKPTEPKVISRFGMMTFDVGTGQTWAASIEKDSVTLYQLHETGNSVTYNLVASVGSDSPKWPSSCDGSDFEELARQLVRKCVGLSNS